VDDVDAVLAAPTRFEAFRIGERHTLPDSHKSSSSASWIHPFLSRPSARTESPRWIAAYVETVSLVLGSQWGCPVVRLFRWDLPLGVSRHT
jgi:hypothetical protein